MSIEDRAAQAQDLADNLAIPIFLDEVTGRITQHGPGREFFPKVDAGPRSHGAIAPDTKAAQS